MNRAKVAEVTPVDHIAKFNVSLQDGLNIFLAVAGECKDTMTLEKVETEPSIYTLPVTDDGNEGAANWFTAEGSLDLEAPMEFPEGKLSIKNTLAEVANNPDALAFFCQLSGRQMGPGMPMWEMISNMSVEMMMSMAGNIPEGAMAMINKKLNAFDLMK